VTRPPAPPLTPAEQDRVAAFEAAPYPAEVAERLEWPLGWKPGACTECGAAKADCTAPDYCCAECLHLADDWEGYDDAAPDRPDTAAELERQRLYEHLCTVVQDGRSAHRNDTTSIVADDGYERIVQALLPLTEPIHAWLNDTYGHPTPFSQIEALLDFIQPRGAAR
jgi:hypothetical protein